MTEQATVDGEQLAVLRLLRQRFDGQVEVLEVRPSAELLPAAGQQASLTEE